MNILPNQLLPACRRRNHVLAAYVNAAVTARRFLGLKRAEEFALKAGVPAQVLLRVMIAGGPFRPHARFEESPLKHGLSDASAEASAYFRTQDASAAYPLAVNRRVDRRMALLVDAAINAAASHGIAGATAELIDQGVPVELIFRVLCQPGARRRHALPSPPADSWMRPGLAFPCRRRNRMDAAYVDAALTISKMISVERAEAMLVKQGIPERVIVRILHLNGFRRGQGKAPANGHDGLRPATAYSPPHAPS